MQQKMIQFSGDVSLPAIGQGTWYMGEDASQRKTEVAALRAGIELGLTSLIPPKCMPMVVPKGGWGSINRSAREGLSRL